MNTKIIADLGGDAWTQKFGSKSRMGPKTFRRNN